jgi:penicillin-binding protein 1A
MAVSSDNPADVGGRDRTPGVLRWWRLSWQARWLRRMLWTFATCLLVSIALFATMLVLTPSAQDAADRAAAKIAVQSGGAQLTSIPARIAAAVLATEDHRFYEHPGVDPIALGRVGIGLLHGVDGGGATIEAQLAKLLYTGDRGDWAAHVDLAGLAVKLDQRYTKDQILLMYLNVAYFGHGFYGVQLASVGYFGKAPQALDWAQAALLAGLLQSPTNYDPVDHPLAAMQRRHHVLERLVANGVLSTPDATEIDGHGLELT